MSNSKTVHIRIGNDYIVTDYIKNTADKAIIYLKNKFPVHLRGAAGTGKTSLAFYIAEKIGRPVLFLCGSEEVNTANLIGGYFGAKSYFVEDNYISKVYKKEEEIKKTWSDGKLLTACKNGYTVIYDEFTRAKPEINNVLLSILEEKIIDIPYYSSYDSTVKIHPEFHIIFTSNPEEYEGVYKSSNALLDRMITIDMDGMDEETVKSIIISKSGINEKDAEKIIRLSEYIKSQISGSDYASMRNCIMLAKIINQTKIKIDSSDNLFRQICMDIYNSVDISLGLTQEEKKAFNELINKAINMIC